MNIEGHTSTASRYVEYPIDVITCETTDSGMNALRLMKRFGIHHLPVLAHNRLVGMISDRDIMSHTIDDSFESLNTVTVEQMMHRDVPPVTPSSEVRDVINTILNGTYEALPVVQNGILTGIITTSDVLKLTAKLTEDQNEPPYGSVYLANPFAQRILTLLADIGI